MTINDKEKMKKTFKESFKESFKEAWETYKWQIYIGVTGLSLLLLYDFIQLLLK